MNITEAEIELLEKVTSEAEWAAACDVIKRARDGRYPGDWWAKVKMTGMMERIMTRFGGSTEIKVEYR